jgi:RHS repeat-associated protein
MTIISAASGAGRGGERWAVLTTWTYDHAYRLLNENRTSGPVGTSFNLTHVYDNAGNQTVQIANGSITTYSYSPANKLTLARTATLVTTYTNDSAGNRTAEIPSAGASTLFAWDAPGRMISADVVAGILTLTYNADGQRTAKQGTDGSVTGFLYDHKRLLQETDDVGGDVTKTYASTTTDEFGDLIGEDGESAHVYDAQANTDALLDTSGMVEAKYKYTAFGQVNAVAIEGETWATLSVDQWATMEVDGWAGLQVDWSEIPADLGTNMLAGGKKQYYLDPEIQLYLLGSGNNGRYYDPSIGRFISEDPTRQASGDDNLFGYVKNDPVNKLDPSGHETEEEKRRREEAERKEREEQLRQQQAKQNNAVEVQPPAAKPGTENGIAP